MKGSLPWLSRITVVQVWWLKISSLKMNFFHVEILETNLETQCGFLSLGIARKWPYSNCFPLSCFDMSASHELHREDARKVQ